MYDRIISFYSLYVWREQVTSRGGGGVHNVVVVCSLPQNSWQFLNSFFDLATWLRSQSTNHQKLAFDNNQT